MSNTDPIPLTKAQREFAESIPSGDDGGRAMKKISPAELLAGGGMLDAVLGKPSVDLSSRPRRRMITEQPVCSQDLSEASAVVVELLSQMPMQKEPGVGIQHAEALRYARHVASVLMKAKAEGLAENAAMADALAIASIERQKEIPLSIVSGKPGERVTMPPLMAPQRVLDGSIDPGRWAMAFHAAPEEKQTLSEWFARAIGAGIATGRVRERETLIEEMKPVFRNLEILDMWADRMNVKGGERGLALHQDPDARRWAREFIEVIDGLEKKCGHKLCDPATFDEGWLLSWFANAMMASYDWAMAQRDRAEALKARQRDAHVYGPLLFTTILQAANAPLFDSSTTHTEKGEVFHGLAIRVQPWKREHGQPAPQLAVVVAWRRTPGPGLIARWRGKLRLLYGFCPCCNSDAPELDRCEVCLGYSPLAGAEYPPNAARKAVWRKRWMEGKGIRPSQSEECISSASDEAGKSNVSDSAASIVTEKSDMPQTISQEEGDKVYQGKSFSEDVRS